MIRIPLDFFNDKGPCITVEDIDGSIYLAFELEAEELGSARLVTALTAYGDANTPEEQVKYLAKANGELNDRLTKVATLRSVDRCLHPAEARALAAALVHYATEAER